MCQSVLVLCRRPTGALKHIIDIAYSPFMETLEFELEKQAARPPGGDERIAAFCRGMLELPSNSPIRQQADAYSSPSYGINFTLRALQKQLLRVDASYPENFVTTRAWTDAIANLEAEPERLVEFETDTRTRSVQSNVVERYKAFKLTAILLAERISDSPRMLDVGCSRNHGLKKLKANLPFQPVTLDVAPESRWSQVFLDMLVNTTMRQPTGMGPSVGADIVPYLAGADAEWARSCSFYPSELLYKPAVAEYDYLDTNNFRDVAFALADFTSQGFLEPVRTREFDMITASTVLYQFSSVERQRAREHFRDLLSDNGVIVYQDFAEPSANGRDLQFFERWHEPYNYRTLVEFAGDERVYELFRWNNGRCSKWRPGNDLETVLENHKQFTLRA
jgi:hypothetical protein